jgi:hypothetical protein
LLLAPRPFQISYDAQAPGKYRIFFAEREPDGAYSSRSVTEDGQREYQVIGPATSYVRLYGESDEPAQNFTPSALPAAFHPAEHILIWQDAKGCFQQLPYSYWNWGKPAAVAGDPGGGSLTATPNGAALEARRARNYRHRRSRPLHGHASSRISVHRDPVIHS